MHPSIKLRVMFPCILVLSLVACSPSTNCDALADLMASPERQARVVGWVDEQAAAGRLAS